MKDKWKLEKCSTKPEQFQQLSSNVWLQRKNIQKEPDEEGGGYKCESRRISSEVYEALMEERDSLLMEVLTDGQEVNEDTIAALLLNQIEIQQTQEKQDDVLAEILLNQIGEMNNV